MSRLPARLVPEAQGRSPGTVTGHVRRLGETTEQRRGRRTCWAARPRVLGESGAVYGSRGRGQGRGSRAEEPRGEAGTRGGLGVLGEVARPQGVSQPRQTKPATDRRTDGQTDEPETCTALPLALPWTVSVSFG